jgi:F0F1-type ATP synthase epsilon subunit
MGGVLQFKDEECLILTTLAEPGEEIDEMRARESLERGRRLLKEANAKIDSKRVEASIARAKARLKAKLNDADV